MSDCQARIVRMELTEQYVGNGQWIGWSDITPIEVTAADRARMDEQERLRQEWHDYVLRGLAIPAHLLTGANAHGSAATAISPGANYGAARQV